MDEEGKNAAAAAAKAEEDRFQRLSDSMDRLTAAFGKIADLLSKIGRMPPR